MPPPPPLCRSALFNLSLFRAHLILCECQALQVCQPRVRVVQFPISGSATGHAGIRRIDLTAIVVPKVTCDLPLSPIPFNQEWQHLADLPLADPGFDQPGPIDLLLGVDIFVDVLLHGRRNGPPGAPVALEMELGWVLGGGTECAAPANQVNLHVLSFHTSTLTGDGLYSASFGRLKKGQDRNLYSLLKRSMYFNISRIIIVAQRMADLLYPCQENLVLE